MVLSWDPNNQFPNMDDGTYDVMSMRVGADTVIVWSSDRYKKNPTCMPTNYAGNTEKAC